MEEDEHDNWPHRYYRLLDKGESVQVNDVLVGESSKVTGVDMCKIDTFKKIDPVALRPYDAPYATFLVLTVLMVILNVIVTF